MPVKQTTFRKRLFKNLLVVGFPTIIGFAGSVALAQPGISVFDWEIVTLFIMLLGWLLILAYKDLVVDRNYTQVLAGFEDQIYNTRNALEILETIPANRSKKLASMLNSGEDISSERLVDEFLRSRDGIDSIVEAVTEYLARRTEAGERQSFRVSFAKPIKDGSDLMVVHSSAKRARPPALQQVFSPNDPATSGTTAVQAWQIKRAIAIPDVEATVRDSERSGKPAGFKYLNDDEKSNLKSILCIPIYSTDGPTGPEHHGLLSIDTNEKGFFEEINIMEEYRWCKILTPFADRIAFYARLTKASDVALGTK